MGKVGTLLCNLAQQVAPSYPLMDKPPPRADHLHEAMQRLILNYLDHFYPSLLKVPKFLVEFVTPIVRVTKGNQKINFFTIPEYERWLEQTPDAHKWKSKYYKVCLSLDPITLTKDHDSQPDLVARIKKGIPFTPYNRALFYVPEKPDGYTDYGFADKEAEQHYLLAGKL